MNVSSHKQSSSHLYTPTCPSSASAAPPAALACSCRNRSSVRARAAVRRWASSSNACSLYVGSRGEIEGMLKACRGREGGV